MASKESIQSNDDHLLVGSTQRCDDCTASQDTDRPAIEELIVRRQDYVRKRRREHKKAVRAGDGSRCTGFRREIDQVFLRYEGKVNEIVRPKLECLLQLIERKFELEAQIDGCISQLETACLSTAQKLQIVLNRRADVASI